MRLFLLGATGRTGTEVIDLALAHGHEVTAYVRSPQKLKPAPRLHVVRGDPRDQAALAASLSGHAAVLSALGPSPREAFRAGHHLLAECATSTVDAMTTSGVKRLVIVSAALLFPENGLRFRVFRWLLKHHVRDLREMEDVVRTSGVEWTIARPPRLTQSRDEHFRAERDALPSGSFSTSFRSVAAFMLEAVEQHSHETEIVGLAS
jgi:putative NADH-flavin reductase